MSVPPWPHPEQQLEALTAHIKDLLAFLRILENPHDELSWMRVLQLLDGIGPGRARQAVEHVQQAQNGPRSLLTWKAPAAIRNKECATLEAQISPQRHGDAEKPKTVFCSVASASSALLFLDFLTRGAQARP